MIPCPAGHNTEYRPSLGHKHVDRIIYKGIWGIKTHFKFKEQKLRTEIDQIIRLKVK